MLIKLKIEIYIFDFLIKKNKEDISISLLPVKFIVLYLSLLIEI